MMTLPMDRLYLQKENDESPDIFVNLCKQLPQHQIDGIRFLFRQFYMKAPGVILNDPSGYGKCLQVVLFLSAIRPLIKKDKPVLILSNSVENWKEHFAEWTDCDDDISFNSSSPFESKKIYVNSLLQYGYCHRFRGRTWGIVVLHDEIPWTKELLSMSFKADYKIWLHTNNLKEDLHTLAAIYEWLHPNQKFNVELFTAKKGNWRDEFEKALLLDAFVEDFLIRRDGFKRFAKPDKPSPAKLSNVPIIRPTLKNKDPTGTKVKRSKRRRIEDDEVSVKNDDNLNQSNATYRVSTETDNITEVEQFIRNKKPIDSQLFHFVQSSDSSHDNVTVTKTAENPLDNGNGVKGITRIDNFQSNPKENVVENSDSQSIFTEVDNAVAESIKIVEIENTQKVVEVIAAATEDENSASQDNFGQTIVSVDNSQVNKSKSNKYVPETENSQDTQSIIKNEGQTATGKDSVASNDWKIDDDEDVDKYKEKSLPETKMDKDVPSSINRDEKIELVKDNTMNNSNDMVGQNFEIGDSENSLYKDKNGGVSSSIIGNGKTENTKDNITNINYKTNFLNKGSEVNDLDAQLADLEAKALKKFKGSFLDSLF